MILNRFFSDLRKQVHESQATEVIKTTHHNEELVEQLNKTIVELRDEKALLEAQLQNANATLSQIEKSLRPHSLRLNTASTEASTSTSSEGELTPTSTTASHA